MDIQRQCVWCGRTYIAHSYGNRYCCGRCKSDAKKPRTRERIEAENSTVATVLEIGVLGNKPFLTPKDVAVLFETTTTSIYRYIYQGLIKAVKLSENKIVIRCSDIDSLFDNAPVYKKKKYERKAASEYYTMREMNEKYCISRKAIRNKIQSTIDELLADNPNLTTKDINKLLYRQFGTRIHKGTIKWNDQTIELRHDVQELLRRNNHVTMGLPPEPQQHIDRIP